MRSAPRPLSIRFAVDPRDIPSFKVARRLGLSEAEFNQVKDRLFARHFPRPDPDTGLYDLKAVDYWMDKRSGLAEVESAHDSSVGFNERLERLRGTARKKS